MLQLDKYFDTHIAFDQSRQLVLNAFRLSQKAFLHSQLLQPCFVGANPIRLCVTVGARSF